MAGLIEKTKKMRSGHAGWLTRCLNQALRATNEGRSRRYLADCFEQIEVAMDSLQNGNDVYIAQLSSKEKIQEACQWFEDRKENAEQVLRDLGPLLNDKGIPSVTITDTNSIPSQETSSISDVTETDETESTRRRQKLLLEAEEAQLELKQAYRRADLEAKKADLKTMQTAMKTKEVIEKAELKVTSFQALMKANSQPTLRRQRQIDGIPVDCPSRRTLSWLGGVEPPRLNGQSMAKLQMDVRAKMDPQPTRLRSQPEIGCDSAIQDQQVSYSQQPTGSTSLSRLLRETDIRIDSTMVGLDTQRHASSRPTTICEEHKEDTRAERGYYQCNRR